MVCLTQKSSVFAKMILVTSLGALAVACSTDVTDVRYVLKPSTTNQWMQVNESIKLKSEALDKVPPAFTSSAIDCGSSSSFSSFLGNKSNGSLAPKDSLIFQVKIRNDGHNVSKLLSSEVTLFDPQGNRYSALDRGKLKLHFMSQENCSDSPQLNLQFANLKLVDGKLKILPGRANLGYVIFTPKDLSMQGSWTLSFFDLAAFSVRQLENNDPQTLTYKFTLNKYADVYTKNRLTGAISQKITRNMTPPAFPENPIEKKSVKKESAQMQPLPKQVASPKFPEPSTTVMPEDISLKAAEVEKLAAEKAYYKALQRLAIERAAKEVAERRAAGQRDLEVIAQKLADEKLAAKRAVQRAAALKAERAATARANSLEAAARKAIAAAKAAAADAERARLAAQAAAVEQDKIARTAANFRK